MPNNDETGKGSTEVDIALVIDENGNYSVARYPDTAVELHNADFFSGIATNIIMMKIRVPIPKHIEVSATLPQQEDGNYSLEVKPA